MKISDIFIIDIFHVSLGQYIYVVQQCVCMKMDFNNVKKLKICNGNEIYKINSPKILLDILGEENGRLNVFIKKTRDPV
jgi:hypothetical protein